MGLWHWLLFFFKNKIYLLQPQHSTALLRQSGFWLSTVLCISMSLDFENEGNKHHTCGLPRTPGDWECFPDTMCLHDCFIFSLFMTTFNAPHWLWMRKPHPTVPHVSVANWKIPLNLLLLEKAGHQGILLHSSQDYCLFKYWLVTRYKINQHTRQIEWLFLFRLNNKFDLCVPLPSVTDTF